MNGVFTMDKSQDTSPDGTCAADAFDAESVRTGPASASAILAVLRHPGGMARFAESLSDAGWCAMEAASPEEALACLRQNSSAWADDSGSAREELQRIRAVVCDRELSDSGKGALWLLEEMRSCGLDEAPVIVLADRGNLADAVACMRLGAADYLEGPLTAGQLIEALSRVKERQQKNRADASYQKTLEKSVADKAQALSAALLRLESAYGTTLLALVAALDAREHETGDHSLRVVRFCEAIARRMGIFGEELQEICRGALLHDIGKIGVPDAILLKPGPLSDSEWTEMRRHPQVGFNILKKIDFLKNPSEIVLTHHERFDGHGYPRQLSGNEIPLGARIFAVADTLDAMTSNRPYRRAVSFQAARDEIIRCSGTQFDPDIVRAFLDISEAEFVQKRAAPEKPFP